MSKPEGLCQLTLTRGPFARSHIIPDAFMRRLTTAPFREWGGEGHAPKRFSGWYDTQLLSPDGEKLIADYDDHAAKVFLGAGWTYRRRRHPDFPELLCDNFVAGQIYDVRGVDVGLLKLFGLSLLWRAAASKLEAFSLVNLRPEFLEHLRLRVLTGDPGSAMDIPVYFSLFDSGEELTKVAPAAINGHPFYRFFLDGVVCYVAKGRSNLWSRRVAPLLIGAQPDRLLAVCVESRGSAHHEYAEAMMRSLAQRHGDVFRGQALRPYQKR